MRRYVHLPSFIRVDLDGSSAPSFAPCGQGTWPQQTWHAHSAWASPEARPTRTQQPVLQHARRPTGAARPCSCPTCPSPSPWRWTASLRHTRRREKWAQRAFRHMRAHMSVGVHETPAREARGSRAARSRQRGARVRAPPTYEPLSLVAPLAFSATDSADSLACCVRCEALSLIDSFASCARSDAELAVSFTASLALESGSAHSGRVGARGGEAVRCGARARRERAHARYCQRAAMLRRAHR